MKCLIFGFAVASFCALSAFAGGSTSTEVFSDLRCEVPSNSQWHDSVEILFSKMSDVVVAKMVSSKKTSDRPTAKPDFIPPGYAIDQRPGVKSAPNTTWTFEIERTIKGGLKPLSSIEVTSTVGAGLLHPLSCDQNLNFTKGKSYVLFLGSYNPSGYKMATSAWLKSVGSISEK